MIFVFGSNTAGRHGAGAALTALKLHGARYGVGFGRQGNSYAIPTKNENLRTLPIGNVREQVDDFIQYAALHPRQAFQVTRIGTGLAGFSDGVIAPLFEEAPPSNCFFDLKWRPILGENFEYWGSF